MSFTGAWFWPYSSLPFFPPTIPLPSTIKSHRAGLYISHPLWQPLLPSNNKSFSTSLHSPRLFLCPLSTQKRRDLKPYQWRFLWCFLRWLWAWFASPPPCWGGTSFDTGRKGFLLAPWAGLSLVKPLSSLNMALTSSKTKEQGLNKTGDSVFFLFCSSLFSPFFSSFNFF